MLKIKSSWKLSLIVPVLFLIIGIWTLSDYGFNSDEPFHFYRGQAYLNFFLTGKKDYSNLSAYPRINNTRCDKTIKPEDCKISPPPPSDIGQYQGSDLTYEKAVARNEKKLSIRRSFFQHDSVTFNEVIKIENGHPPLGGILAALTNHIFYQNLKIIPDVESHHLAEILLSFIALSAVAIFAYFEFGLLVSFVSTFAIATYPLFFSESHFNVKDPPETAFFGLTIVAFYYAIVRKKWKLLILSSIFAGMALSIKFNALFLPFIVGPWLLWYFLQGNLKLDKINKNLFLSFLSFPLVTLLVFYTLWPYLWPDPFGNIQQNIAFYKSSGLGTSAELGRYIFHKINTFPIIWIVITTPLPVLALSLLGIFYSIIKLFSSKNSVYLLLLLWFAVPIIRVSLPNAAIYGGVRHIMEFILPLGILSGLGVKLIWQIAKNKIFKIGVSILLLVSMGFTIWESIRLHPNENVYFNQLVGGLKGAKEKNVPFWGNSYGNAYLQGVNWLNKNAEPNARLGLPVATMANLPRLALRSDIFFNNGFWSGPNKKGEYEIEQTHNFPQKSWYSFAYYDIFLNPVYEVKVDGVAILKVWKNDLEHTKDGFKEEIEYPNIIKQKDNMQIVIDLSRKILLTKLEIEHSFDNCQVLKGGELYLSLDGNLWFKELEPIDYPQVPPEAVGWDNDTFVYLFAAKEARFIRINTDLDNSCILKDPIVKTLGLKRLPDLFK